MQTANSHLVVRGKCWPPPPLLSRGRCCEARWGFPTARSSRKAEWPSSWYPGSPPYLFLSQCPTPPWAIFVSIMCPPWQLRRWSVSTTKGKLFQSSPFWTAGQMVIWGIQQLVVVHVHAERRCWPHEYRQHAGIICMYTYTRLCIG